MKVIKRDGRAVDYDRQKIAIAIGKANQEVFDKEKATKSEIKEITQYIEALDKKRMLVEDIQDIIEQKLMEIGKFTLAKKYIVYRYTRALVRKQNTTDESILGLIRNNDITELQDESNKNRCLASSQRNYIAGEVSRDLTKRLLLPEKITKASQEGVLHFHNTDYFIQPIFNCSLINLADMLDNGTVINGKIIETPKSFKVACEVITQIISNIASNQYGAQSINIAHLGKYVKMSYIEYKKELIEKYNNRISLQVIEDIVQDRVKEEIKFEITNMQYQINALKSTNIQNLFINLFLYLDPKDEYINENAMIIEEILYQTYKGIKNENGKYVMSEIPKLIYVLDSNNNLSGGKYDYLTRLAIKSSIKGARINYLSAKKMKENFKDNIFSPIGNENFLNPYKDAEGNYKFEGRFNQGIVTINLPQIGIIADGNEKEFWRLLYERLELCKEALMCRHYALLGTRSDISPIHWQYGAISRLEKGKEIDELLKNGYSTLSLGYLGIYEITKLITGESHTNGKGHKFAIDLMNILNNVIEKWNKETGLEFNLCAISSKKLAHNFARIDKERFGTISDITDKKYYTNSYFINSNEKIDIFEKLKIESQFQDLSNGGAISYININNMEENIEKIENIIKFVYDNVLYATLEINN